MYVARNCKIPALLCLYADCSRFIRPSKPTLRTTKMYIAKLFLRRFLINGRREPQHDCVTLTPLQPFSQNFPVYIQSYTPTVPAVQPYMCDVGRGYFGVKMPLF